MKFMLERARQRRIATDCRRCGGTGNYSNVGFSGVGSRHGTHCFSCGDAWRLPIKWKRMSAKEIANLFEENVSKDTIMTALKELMEVGILDNEKYQEVRRIKDLEAL